MSNSDTKKGWGKSFEEASRMGFENLKNIILFIFAGLFSLIIYKHLGEGKITPAQFSEQFFLVFILFWFLMTGFNFLKELVAGKKPDEVNKTVFIQIVIGVFAIIVYVLANYF